MRFVIIILLLAFTACKSTKPIVVENYHRDSIFLSETIRDTLVKVESDSAMIRALVECDSLGNAHIRELIEYKVGKRTAPPTLSLKKNLLTATTTTDSIGIYLTLKDRYKERFKKEATTKIVEVNVLTQWQKYWIKAGKTSAVFGAVLMLIILLRLWMRRR